LSEARKDILLSIGLIGVGAVALVSILMTTGERRISGAEAMTFATMPAIYSGFLIGLSVIFLIGALRRARSITPQRSVDVSGDAAEREATSDPSRRTVALRTVATLVALLAYTLLLEFIHFWIVTTVFLALMFVVFGQRSPLRIGLVSVCGGTVFYALFILAIDLPI